MTSTTRSPLPDADDTDDSAPDLELGGQGGERGDGGAPPAPPGSRWWRIGFPVAMVVLVVAIPVLVRAGVQVLLDSNDGQLIPRITDPAAPGWEAVVEPTPTELVMTVDAENDLQGLAVLILSGETSGAVLQVPVETIVTLPVGELTLSYLWFALGEAAVRDNLSVLLNLSFSDTRVIRPDEWASLVAPVSPLTVNSPDAAVGPDGQVLFPRGSIEVPAAQVPTYLGALGPGESDLARLVRVEAFWRAWITATGTAGLQTVPPPVEQGLGRFLGALGSGQVTFVTLPVTQASPGPPALYRARPEAVAATIAELVPFPVGPPGGRTTLRVLDATGQLDHGTTAAVTLGAASGQVEVIGNAAGFGDPVSQIIYFDDAYLADAERMRATLGVGELVRSEERSAVQVTVVLGADGVGRPGIQPPADSTSTAPGIGGTGG